MLRKLLAVLLVILAAISCQQSKQTIASGKPDPLLGKWVCLADNVNSNPKHTMEFRSDGTVLMKFDGEKPQTMRYRREPGKEWAKRRSPMPGVDSKDMPWNQPGAEMISFAGPDGQFMDYGGGLLTLDPKEQILANPLTQLWCRPGDEARIRKLSGMDAREAQDNKETAERKAWRPKKDITKRLRMLWKVDLPGEEKGYFGVAAGDIDGDRIEEAIVSSIEGVHVVDSKGKIVRRVDGGEGPHHFLALGKSNGQSLIVHFGVWGRSLPAYDTTGKLKWKFSSSQGMDWVTPVKIDAKNTAFFIGYNGGGVELVGSIGQDLWHAGVASNVWSVASAKLDKGLAESAICVGPDGALAFDVKGDEIGKYGPEDAGAVGAADLNGDGIDEVLTLGTTVSSGLKVSAFDAKGKRLWSHKASDSGAAFVKGAPFVFGRFGKEPLLGVADGAAIRFFRGDGTWVGDALIPGYVQSVARLSRKGLPDALLVRAANQLRCYELLER